MDGSRPSGELTGYSVGSFADDDLLTVNAVAERLQVNPQTVRNWITAGKCPAVRIGRRVRIRRSDLEVLTSTPRPRRGRPPRQEKTEAEMFWEGTWVTEPDYPLARPDQELA